jgi:hypothetical protein
MSVNDVCVMYGEGVSMIAEAAIDDYDVVMLGTAPNYVLKTSAITSIPFGVVRNGAAAGSSVTVYPNDGCVFLCRANAGTIAKGALVGPTADGEVAPITVAGAAKKACGQVLKARVATDDIIPVWWQPGIIQSHA